MAELLAQIETRNGRLLDVFREGVSSFLLTDHGALTRPIHVHGAELGLLVMQAVDEDVNDGAKLIGTIGSVHVVRWPIAVGLTTHPNPRAHAGWKLGLDHARELARVLAA